MMSASSLSVPPLTLKSCPAPVSCAVRAVPSPARVITAPLLFPKAAASRFRAPRLISPPST